MAVLSMFRRFFIVFCYQGPAISRLIANTSNLISVLEVFRDLLPRHPWKFSIGHILLHLERSLYFYKWQCIYALPWGRCYNIYEDNVYRHYSSLKNWKGHTWSYTYSIIWIFAYIWSNPIGQVWPVSVSPGTGVVTSPNSKIFFNVMFFFFLKNSLAIKVGFYAGR